MRKIKAILIDPFACTVTAVEVDGDDHRSYYPHLSHATMPVDTFTSVPIGWLSGNDTLFVDDDGLHKDAQRWFLVFGGHQAFAGKGLIVGADWDGDAVSAHTDEHRVQAFVTFVEAVDKMQDEVMLAVTRTPWEPSDEA